MTYILGINSAYHESSACLIKDGKIIAMAEEERFNRIKHGKVCLIDNPNELPFQSIDFCLKQANISFDQISYIGFSLNPKKRMENKNFKDHEVFSKGWGSTEGENLFNEKLKSIPKILEDTYKTKVEDKFHFIDHHICHAASAFFVSPFDRSAIIVVDGIGETEAASIYFGNKNIIEKKYSVAYPDSIGFLWEKISQYLGFSEYDACKVMGMAAYGTYELLINEFRKIVSFEDGDCHINNEIVKFRTDDMSGIENILGPRRSSQDKLEQRHYDIAAALQRATEITMLNLSIRARKLTGSNNLCMSGGVALNCVANSQVASHVENIYIQPATHDAGTSIGAAFYIWNQILGKERSYVMDNPYLGPEYSGIECVEVALENKVPSYIFGDLIYEKAAKLIADGNIVAWFQGRMEVGPRALGNRSLLADPRNPKVREMLNQKTKHREDFRPFAPSVLFEQVHEWFDMNNDSISNDFMLFTYPVKREKGDLIPSVLHVDETARLQTVRKEINPHYHRLISEFYKLTGVPMLLNTSFNDNEPIVCSPQDAINTFLKTKIDYLVMDQFLLKRA